MSTIGDLVTNLRMDTKGFTSGVAIAKRESTSLRSTVSATNPAILAMSAAERKAANDALVMAQALRKLKAEQDAGTRATHRHTAALNRNGKVSKGGSQTIQQLGYAFDDFANSTGPLSNRLRGVSNNVSTVAFQSGRWQGMLIGIAAAALPSVVKQLENFFGMVDKSNTAILEATRNLSYFRKLGSFEANIRFNGISELRGQLASMREEDFGLQVAQDHAADFAAKRDTPEAVGALNDVLQERAVLAEKIARTEKRIGQLNAAAIAENDRTRIASLQRESDQRAKMAMQEQAAIWEQDRQRQKMLRNTEREIKRVLDPEAAGLLDIGDRLAERIKTIESGFAGAARDRLVGMAEMAAEKERRDLMESLNPTKKPAKAEERGGIGTAARGTTEAARAIAKAQRGAEDKKTEEKQTAKNTAMLVQKMDQFLRRQPITVESGTFDD